MLPSAGAGTFYFVGQFRPQGIGSTDSLAAVIILAAIAVGAAGLSVVPWLTRSRTERHS